MLGVIALRQLKARVHLALERRSYAHAGINSQPKALTCTGSKTSLPSVGAFCAFPYKSTKRAAPPSS